MTSDRGTIIHVPVMGGIDPEGGSTEPKRESAEDFAMRHAAAEKSPTAQAEIFLGFAQEQAAALISQARVFAREMVEDARKKAEEIVAMAKEHAKQIVESAKEQAKQIIEQARQHEELTEKIWSKRREDHDAVMTSYAAIEEHGYKTATGALEDKSKIFALLRTPVKPAKTGGELAYMGFRQILNTAESIVTKDPRILGPVAKMLGDLAEQSHSEQAGSSKSKDGSEPSSEANPTTLAEIPVQTMLECLEKMTPEELGGREVKDLTLEQCVELVGRKYAPPA